MEFGFMWEPCTLERVAERKLKKEFGRTPGSELFASYVTVRKHLVENILDQIRAVQPELTDHGPEHIRNVINNAEQLLNTVLIQITGIELYCLLVAIIFHDVGNVFSRAEHQHNISAIYDYARPPGLHDVHEKRLILKAVGAHCSSATDISKDTLSLLGEGLSLKDKPINLRKIAAILRFADELAEGPQRTSNFMRIIGGYPEDSRMHHLYSQITRVFIDGGNNRIALTYHIPLVADQDGSYNPGREQEVTEILNYIFKRIIKLNQERQYAKYYCDLLLHFKKTTVVLNFWNRGDIVDLDLGDLDIPDLVIPGDYHKELHEYNPSYMIPDILGKIRANLPT